MWRPNKYMKRCLRSFSIQEMQTEFTGYHYTFIEMAKHVKKLTIPDKH